MPAQPRVNSSRPDLPSNNRRSSTQNPIHTGPSSRPYNGQSQPPIGQMAGFTSQPFHRPAMPISSYSSPTQVPQIGSPGHRTASEPFLLNPHIRQPSQSQVHVPAPSSTYGSTSTHHQGPHGSTSQGHTPDDCPGCRADLEAVLRASEASALEETRLREERQREEDEHWRAMRVSEEEEKRLRQKEEEEMRQVLKASQRDEEEAQRRRLENQREEEEHRRLMLEESRQIALREDEERIQKAHADLIERSRREAEELAQKKRMEEERMQAMEAAAIEESRREMEEEWRRRDEQEKAMAEFAKRGGKQGEAAYWQQVSNEQAYGLALEMDRTLSFNNEGSTSSRPSSRRPLPPTPGAAAFAAGVENRSSHPIHQNGTLGEIDQSWNHPEDEFMDDDSDGEDPFGDQAEALPTYDEIRTDRPPEAPEVIPEHVRFARPQVLEPSHSNTIAMPLVQPEKTPISANTTPRAQTRDLELAVAASSSTVEDLSRSSLPAPLRTAPRRPSNLQAMSPPVACLDEPEAIEERLPAIVQQQQIPPRHESMMRTNSRSTISSTHSTGEHLTSLESPSPTSDTSTSRAPLLQQRAMKGTDFGYCQEPFSPHLSLQDGEEDKKQFPSMIRLKDTRADGTLREGKAYFVVRAYSWKMLLRALAWYGNTGVEFESEEIANATTPLKLRLEVEFVTPTKVDPSMNAQSDFNKNAHVAMCMSLIHPNSTLKPSDAILATALKQSSLALDATYLRRGATRRIITLPSNAPVLPLALVRLAQHLHQAHVFSAACPSTSHVALHSPRDLTRAIDKHDFSYLIKVKKLRKEQQVAVGASSSNPHSAGQKAGRQREDDDEQLHEGEVEAFGEEDSAGTGKMSRVKAKVLRKLAKRSGESNAVDQDLESWISEFWPSHLHLSLSLSLL